MRIGAFSRRTGLSADTLRYYERIGLVPRAGRDAGGRRDYGEDHLRWMEFLDVLKSTGMRIEEMRRYVALRADGPETVPDRLAMLRTHRERVAAERARLLEVETVLDAKIALFQSVTDGSASPNALTCASTTSGHKESRT
ncbi:MerR family transcriptional regulator [Jannaschia sp. LMIT008]|uniref:MerR family transcriptional regulator n=1 Tax=Jannaschia maritima TaxID=3032585 RepID=UPI0028115D78|nr:MerR family transcriptional regulator [Jannaschia sp. LMIT008]